MRLLSFLKFLKINKAITPEFDLNEYVPSFWEDDYCQIEIVPAENTAFILAQAKQINDLAQETSTDYGFTEAFERDSMPTTTLSKEIRIDYLENTFSGFQLQKAKYIRYDKNKILNTETGTTKAFGFPNFTIFFDTKNEFVKNIWINIPAFVSVTEFDLIKEALYSLGEECGLVLIDWNTLELFDLADQKQIQKYLMARRK
jgi:hypothetical protein